jgi:hypothetical protein
MSQYLIAFCYLVTIFLLFLAFFIVRAVPSGSPFNIDLYRDNTIISLAIYNPAELQYRSGPPQEKFENTTGTLTGTRKTTKTATIVSTTKTLGMHPSTRQINQEQIPPSGLIGYSPI